MYARKEKLGDIVKFLINFNFTNSEIKKFLCNTKRSLSSLDTLENDYKHYHKKMISLGYTDDEIRELACRYPKAITFKFCKNKLKQEYVDYLISLDYKPVEENNYFEFDKIISLLRDLGVSEKRIDFIFTKNTPTIFMNPDDIVKNIMFYYSCGLSDENIVTLLNLHASFLEYGEEDYKEAISKLPLLGLNRLDFGKIILNLAKARRVIVNDVFVSFVNWILTKPMNLEKVGKIILKTSSLVTLPEESLEDGFKKVCDLGFTEEETGTILSDALSVITMSFENLSYKMSIPLSFGVSEEDVKKIILGYPGYLTLSPETLMEKFKIYYKRGLLKYIVSKPKNIIQNAMLTDARAEYLNTYFNCLDKITYARMIFTSEDIFKKRFNGSNKYVRTLLQK